MPYMSSEDKPKVKEIYRYARLMSLTDKEFEEFFVDCFHHDADSWLMRVQEAARDNNLINKDVVDDFCKTFGIEQNRKWKLTLTLSADPSISSLDLVNIADNICDVLEDKYETIIVEKSKVEEIKE